MMVDVGDGDVEDGDVGDGDVDDDNHNASAYVRMAITSFQGSQNKHQPRSKSLHEASFLQTTLRGEHHHLHSTDREAMKKQKSGLLEITQPLLASQLVSPPQLPTMPHTRASLSTSALLNLLRHPYPPLVLTNCFSATQLVSE